MEKLKKNYLGLPLLTSLVIFGVLLISIIVGSFVDLDISKSLYNRTDVGDFFAKYAGFIPMMTYVLAGSLLFIAFRKKGKNNVAWALLVLGFLVAMYFSIDKFGGKMREAFGYSAENVWGPTILSFFYTFLVFVWIPPVCCFGIKDDNPKLLIKLALLIFIAGILSDGVNLFLKEFVSRPRFKYLNTLDNNFAGYRGWWALVPFAAGGNNNLMSAPSSHMTMCTMLCVLPLVSVVFKKRFKYLEWVLFGLVLAFAILAAYNRIHMGNHFLTDVAFGVLFTYGIYLLTYTLLFKESDFKNCKEEVKESPYKPKEVLPELEPVEKEEPVENQFKKGKAEGEKETIKKLNKGGLEAKRIAKLLKMDVSDVLSIINSK